MYVGTRYLYDPTSGARRVELQVVQTDGLTPSTSDAGGQPVLSKNGSTGSNTSATLAAVNADYGLYQVQLTSGELDTVGHGMVIYKTAATLLAQATFDVVPSPVNASGVVQASAAAASTSITLPASLNLYDGTLLTFVSGTGIGSGAVVDSYSSGTTVLKAPLVAAVSSGTIFAAYTGAPIETLDVNAISMESTEQGALADKLLGRSLAGSADSTTRNVRNALRRLRNKADGSSAGGTVYVYEEDDSTVAWTGTITRSTSASPVTVVDPS